MESSFTLVVLTHQPLKCWQNNICGVDGGDIYNDGGSQVLRRLCTLVCGTRSLVKHRAFPCSVFSFDKHQRPEENFELISNWSAASFSGASRPDHISFMLKTESSEMTECLLFSDLYVIVAGEMAQRVKTVAEDLNPEPTW